MNRIRSDTNFGTECVGNEATTGIRTDLEALEERLREQLDAAVRNAEAAADEKAAAGASAVTAATALFTAELAQAKADAQRDDAQNDANAEAMSAAVREERERALQELRAQLDNAVKNTESYADARDAARTADDDTQRPRRPTVPHVAAILSKSG